MSQRCLFFFSLFLLFSLCRGFSFSSSASPVLENSLLRLEFSSADEGFSIKQISRLSSSSDGPEDAENPWFSYFLVSSPVWWRCEFSLPGRNESFELTSSSFALKRSAVLEENAENPAVQNLTLLWSSLMVFPGHFIDFSVSLLLGENSSALEISSALSPIAGGEFSSGNVGVWSISYELSQVSFDPRTFSRFSHNASSHQDFLYAPDGFGSIYENPQINGVQYKGDYPSSACTMQFLLLVHEDGNSSGSRGILFFSPDPEAQPKTFSYLGNPMVESHQLALTLFPANSGLSVQNFPVFLSAGLRISFFIGDYYDGLEEYSDWARNQAPWMKKTLAARLAANEIPQDYLNLSVWFNSGWQFLDRFNESQGKAALVLQRALNIAQLLNISSYSFIGFQWYEWNLDRFDTNYPDYFPPQAAFSSTVEILHSQGFLVAPYINGRLFDIHNHLYEENSAVLYTAKRPLKENTMTAVENSAFSPYIEHYGSNASLAVVCPSTEFWQARLTEIIGTLVKNFSVAGVYIDQIGAAVADRCWDSRHSHTIGTANRWTVDYNRFLAGIQKLYGNSTFFVTESNAEPYIGNIHGFLMGAAFLSPFSGQGRNFPLYPAVYGKYFIGFGSFWLREDFLLENAFLYKISWNFLSGLSLGWFSLGGSETFPQMGLYELFMQEDQADKVDFLRHLIIWKANTAISSYFLHGRRQRELSYWLSLNAADGWQFVDNHLMEYYNENWVSSPYPPILISLWGKDSDDDNQGNSQSLSSHSVLLLIVNIAPFAVSLQFVLNGYEFGFSPEIPYGSWTIIAQNGSRSFGPGRFPLGAMEFSMEISPQAVLAVELTGENSVLSNSLR